MPDFLFFLSPRPNFPGSPSLPLHALLTAIRNPIPRAAASEKGQPAARNGTKRGVKRAVSHHGTARFTMQDRPFRVAKRHVFNLKRNAPKRLQTGRQAAAHSKCCNQKEQHCLRFYGHCTNMQRHGGLQPSSDFGQVGPAFRPPPRPGQAQELSLPCRKKPKRLLSCRGASPRTTGGGR